MRPEGKRIKKKVPSFLFFSFARPPFSLNFNQLAKYIMYNQKKFPSFILFRSPTLPSLQPSTNLLMIYTTITLLLLLQLKLQRPAVKLVITASRSSSSAYDHIFPWVFFLVLVLCVSLVRFLSRGSDLSVGSVVTFFLQNSPPPQVREWNVKVDAPMSAVLFFSFLCVLFLFSLYDTNFISDDRTRKARISRINIRSAVICNC